jgi:acetyltransferase-like isoleucine patch superfamily enzyme
MNLFSKILRRASRDWRASSIRAVLGLWFVNKIPGLYILKIPKAFFLKLAGVCTDMDGVYCKSPLQIDRPEALSLGRGVFLNRNVYFEGEGDIRIGSNCQIGPNVVLATTKHDIENNMEPEVGDIVLYDNVWIGANAVLLANVKIGPNVVVAAGSVVNKSFSNCLVAGIPARVVRVLPEAPRMDCVPERSSDYR